MGSLALQVDSEEDVTIINIYAPNIGAPQYVRQMLTSMKGELTMTQK